MKYKCPICGCEEFYIIDGVSSPNENGLIQYKIEIWGDAYLRENVLNCNFETRVCKECGHVDLFKNPKHLRDELENYKKQIAEKCAQIDSLKNKISLLKEEQKQNKSRIVFLEKQLTNDEITIKQQKEYQKELKEINDKNGLLSKTIKDAESNIESLENYINSIPNPHIK